MAGATSKSRGRPTLADVARLAGVSQTTVSFVLNNRPAAFTEATRERVISAVRQLRYSSNAHVAALQQGKSNTLGVQVSFTHGCIPYTPIMGQLMEGISAAAHTHGFHLLFYTGLPGESSAPPAAAFLDRRVDGLIMIAPPIGSQLLIDMADAQFPCVAVLQRHIPPGAMCVDVDNISAARMVVDHLVGIGHRRIAHIAGPVESGSFRDRAEGYRQGLSAAGFPFDPTLVRTMDLESDPAADLHAILRMPMPPTAIFCCDDDTAVIVLQAAAGSGLSVPGDLSIVGFNDLPVSALVSPPLTTVRQPFQQIGRLATSTLITAIAQERPPQSHLLIPAELVVRGTAGEPAFRK